MSKLPYELPTNIIVNETPVPVKDLIVGNRYLLCSQYRFGGGGPYCQKIRIERKNGTIIVFQKESNMSELVQHDMKNNEKYLFFHEIVENKGGRRRTRRRRSTRRRRRN